MLEKEESESDDEAYKEFLASASEDEEDNSKDEKEKIEDYR